MLCRSCQAAECDEEDEEDSYAKYCEDLENDGEFVAVIEYSINTKGEAFIDITLDDFSPESIDKLARIFAAIPTVNFQVKSLEMIEDVFLSQGKDKEFKHFISKTMNASKEGSLKDSDSEDFDPIVCPTKLTL